MKCNWKVTAAAVLLAATATALIFTQKNAATMAGQPAARPEDESAIKAASQAFARAFEKGDAKALGKFFTEEGEYVDEGGEPMRGRAQLEKAYAKFFAERAQIKVESKTSTVRFVSKDTAIEEGTFIVMAKDRPPQASRYSTLYVRQDGQWLIAALKEWGDETTTRPNLQNLAWLIGTWESDGPDLQARTTYEWSESKKFIVGKFTITQKKDKSKVSTGTQIIGIDPALGQIRAWVFDSEGGIGESTWIWDGERWEIESHANLATGQGTSAVIFLKRVSDDAFTVQSVQRTLAGESQPDVGIVKVQRVPSGK